MHVHELDRTEHLCVDQVSTRRVEAPGPSFVSHPIAIGVPQAVSRTYDQQATVHSTRHHRHHQHPRLPASLRLRWEVSSAWHGHRLIQQRVVLHTQQRVPATTVRRAPAATAPVGASAAHGARSAGHAALVRVWVGILDRVGHPAQRELRRLQLALDARLGLHAVPSRAHGILFVE